MKRALITGGAGLLGGELIRQMAPGAEVHATWRTHPVQGCEAHRIELADGAATRALMERVRPDLVIHTAYSMQEGERDVSEATRNVAAAALDAGSELIYMSTDAHLDGEAAPYAESAEPAPLHEYGRWKARAEAYVRERIPAAAVIRTSLIVGVHPPDPRLRWIERGLRGEESVTLFTDEIRSPIAVEDLAAQIREIAALPAEERSGVWHLAGPESLSRYAMGVLLAARLGLSPAPLIPATLASFPSPRPRDLRLLTSRADAALLTRARPISQLLAERGVAARKSPS